VELPHTDGDIGLLLGRRDAREFARLRVGDLSEREELSELQARGVHRLLLEHDVVDSGTLALGSHAARRPGGDMRLVDVDDLEHVELRDGVDRPFVEDLDVDRDG
jgi:hypothetical protein